MSIKRKSKDEEKPIMLYDWKKEMNRYIEIYEYLISLKKTMEDSKAFTKTYIYWLMFDRINAVKSEVHRLFPLESTVYLNDSQKGQSVEKYLEIYGKTVERVRKMKDYVWKKEHPVNNYAMYGQPIFDYKL